MKKIAIILGIGLLSFGTQAQENATKIVVTPGLFGPKGDTLNPTIGVYNWLFGIAQERKLNDRLSIQTAFKFSKKDININEFSGASYADTSYNPFNNASLFTWTNVTELRIYGKEKGALNGFYWGPYLNYASNKLSSDADYVRTVDDNGIIYFGDVQQNIGLSNIGGGLVIGTQKMFDSGLVIDWTILGIGFNNYTASLEYDVTNTSGNFDFRNYEDEIEEAVLDIESWGDISYTIEKERVKAKFSRGFVHFRMALSIGFGY